MNHSIYKNITLFLGVILIIILSNYDIYSQAYNFRHFTVNDGLASSETYHVFQDSKGYIWIATDNGVSRYDGYEFKNFTTEDGLTDNTVFTIYEDYKNRIWFITHSAKLSYYYNNTIHKYKYNDTIQKYLVRNASPTKLSFVVDTNETIYYKDRRNGLFIINKKGKIINNAPRNYSLFYIKNEDNSKHLYVNKKNLNIINRDTIIYYHTKNFNSVDFFKDLNFFFALKKENHYFFASRRKIIRINKLKTYDFIDLPETIVWLSADKKNNLWIGTRKGMLGYKNLDITKNHHYHILKSKTVTSVLEDKEGGYWFTTLYDGVYYTPSLFTKTFFDADNKDDKNITNVTSDSLNIWLSVKEKIIKINTQDTLTIDFQNDDLITTVLYYDKNNRLIWVGSRNLYAYDYNSIKLINFLDRMGKKHLTPHVTDIKYHSNKLWASTSNKGLYLYDNKKNVFISKSIFENKINSICPKNETIYCGCNEGLWTYTIKDSTFSYLGHSNKLLSYRINCIKNNTYHDNIWIGTKSNGIVIYDENDSTYNITTANGLSSNNITSLFLKDNAMWAATQNGLNKITFSNKNLKHSYKIELFKTMHGLVSNEINDIYANDSVSFVATKKGVSIINYKRFSSNNYPPPIYIKNISILDQDTCLLSNYNLTHKQNSIYIQYVGLMYRNNADKKYKYQLRINNKPARWIDTKENYVRFSFLNPGNYSFKVIAINEDGKESESPALINFTIYPPFWKTWWFITFGSILIILGIIGRYTFHITQLKKRNELEKGLLKEINKFKQQALSQQMNPHFIFNTLNSIQYYIYENNSTESTKYLSKFSKLMRLILDNSQNDTIPIQKELDAMNLYLELEALRIEKDFSYKIIVDKAIDPYQYKIYPLLIQPYVENSIWHGLIHKEGEKKIIIEIKPLEEYIICSIEDNGIGREKAMEIKKQKQIKHKSHGTNITGKRIETINKLYNKDFTVKFIDLKNKQGDASGTKVILKIPKILN